MEIERRLSDLSKELKDFLIDKMAKKTSNVLSPLEAYPESKQETITNREISQEEPSTSGIEKKVDIEEVENAWEPSETDQTARQPPMYETQDEVGQWVPIDLSEVRVEGEAVNTADTKDSRNGQPATIDGVWEASMAESFLDKEETSTAESDLTRKTSTVEGGFEKLLTTRVIVWAAAVAMTIGGLLFVRHMAERGMLGPLARVWPPGIGGLVMVALSEWWRNRQGRISQALCGAGVAIMFGAILAASPMVHRFLEDRSALSMLAGMTVLAIVLSLRHGMPVGLLGLAGGFIAPAMIIKTGPAAGQALGYLFLLQLGMALNCTNQERVVVDEAGRGGGWIFGQQSGR